MKFLFEPKHTGIGHGMSLSDRSSPTTVSTTPLNTTDTCFHGRWLVLAWIAWGVLSSGTLVAFAFILPVYFTLLQTICIGAGCPLGQPSPGTVATLHGLGLSVGSYAAFNLVLILASMLLACTISGLLVWRKSHDWMALLVALMLIMLGTTNVSYTVELIRICILNLNSEMRKVGQRPHVCGISHEVVEPLTDDFDDLIQ